MTPERWQQIEALYEALLAQPVEERAAWLDDACRDDPDLRAELESLLTEQDDDPAFLESTFAGLPAPLSADEPLLQEEECRIGTYRLVRELGRGGMGIVYLAERADGQFEKQVALKLLQRGLGTHDLLSRFRYERQILAGLDHPNIAHLIDGGVTDPTSSEPEGRPYFVMEYVTGEPITAYCDRHQLSTQQRLALFRTVCRTVQYAHANLVVHRDLKPSNIFVTEDPGSVPGQAPQVKLLDFGIAKLLDEEAQDTPYTETGMRLLTPEYAAPEQIKDETITTATDVYQLGVLLYELLTGHRPYRLSERLRHEIERVILEEEPTQPSTVISHSTARITPESISTARSTTPQTLQRRLSGDLDTIVLAALKKEPLRRYASVEQFSEDVRRHLVGLPVAARPDTFGYRMAKFVRRHRIGVVATAAVGLLLIGFSGVTAWQSRQIQAKAEEVALERDKSNEVASFLIDLFEAANPSEASSSSTVQQLLTRGTEEIEQDLTAQPTLQASLMEVMGKAHRNLGDYDEAERLALRALALRRAHHGPAHAETIGAMYTLAYVRRSQGDLDEAETVFREALQLSQESLGPDHLNTAAGLYGLAALLAEEKGASEQADTLFRESLAIRRAHLAPDHPDLVSTLSSLVSVLRLQRRYEEAEPLAREVLAQARERYGEGHYRLASRLNSLAALLTVQQEFDEAELLYREALDIYQRVLGADHPHVATVSFNLGRLLMSKEDYAGAETVLREVLALRRTQLGNNHLRTASAAQHLGRALLFQQRPTEAEPLLRETLAIRRTVLGTDHWQTGYTMLQLGLCLMDQQHFAEAGPLLDTSLALIEAGRGADDPVTQQARDALARLDEERTVPVPADI